MCWWSIRPSQRAAFRTSSLSLRRNRAAKLRFARQRLEWTRDGELFKQRADIEILHLPYKGSAPAVQDLLAGQVQLMFDDLPTVLPFIRSGQLRALAVTTAERSSVLPDTPTLAESGLPGFDTGAWFALLVPKATADAVRAEIERAAVRL